MVGYKLVGIVVEEGYRLYQQGLSVAKVLFSLEDFDHLVDLLDLRYLVKERGSFVYFRLPNQIVTSLEEKFYIARRILFGT